MVSRGMLGERNLTLIGMPGAGKTSIGEGLAAALAAPFLDTDWLMEERWGCSLQEFIDREGLAAFRREEEATILSVRVRGHVIGTGGSVVYAPPAMAHLRELGWVVWLDLPLGEIEKRLEGSVEGRGIVRSPSQGLADLYEERKPLYARYAHWKVAARGKTEEELIREIFLQVRARCDGE
jgi:shikimate kinase